MTVYFLLEAKSVPSNLALVKQPKAIAKSVPSNLALVKQPYLLCFIDSDI